MTTVTDLATAVCALEGGAKNLPVAQVSEVLRCLAALIARTPAAEQVWRHYVRRMRAIAELEGPGMPE